MQHIYFIKQMIKLLNIVIKQTLKKLSMAAIKNCISAIKPSAYTPAIEFNLLVPMLKEVQRLIRTVLQSTYLALSSVGTTTESSVSPAEPITGMGAVHK